MGIIKNLKNGGAAKVLGDSPCPKGFAWPVISESPEPVAVMAQVSQDTYIASGFGTLICIREHPQEVP